ncbi:MAG TPA: DegT/DnrJ/EryC1/StrS family aminotransferase [Bacteroidia bacterium]|jgi:perosamine synthetase|nr:DegT/DnrJ/EryC1/StrS family aminotransferase [Bacteroidia bacterium]
MIPVNEPLLNGNEKKYLNECIDTGWISSEGPFVKKLEEQFAAKNNRKYGIAVCNGTAALEVAVEALGITKGDEVILPTFTIISCASAIIKMGAKPVLVDSDLQTWNMDVKQIEAKITPKTKAIMVVHIYGLPVDMDAVIDIAKRHNLKIIEDAAEAHGQTYKGKACGSFGDISVFSFYPNKLITTGEGGMVLTDDPRLAERCKSLRNLCFSSKRFVHEELGWNMRMTNLQAALGVAQLERWDEFIGIKKKMGKLYTSLLKDEENISIPVEKTAYAENMYWVFGVISENKNVTAEMLMKKLADKGIGTRPFFYPMHLQPVFKKMGLFVGESYPNAEKMYEYGFYLPSGLALTEAQMQEVAKTLKSVLN